MDSTGNTHGIRLRMTPPMRASIAACSAAASDAASCGAGPWRSATSASSNACRAVVAPRASSTTSTPPASAGSAVDSALRSMRRTRPSRVTLSRCGAACRTSVSALGKKKAADGPGIQALGVDEERHLVRRKLHARGPGRGLRQGPACGVEGGCGGCVRHRGPRPATGRARVRLVSPGMHSFSHTSQVTSALMAIGAVEPSSVRGGLMRASSVVSPA